MLHAGSCYLEMIPRGQRWFDGMVTELSGGGGEIECHLRVSKKIRLF